MKTKPRTIALLTALLLVALFTAALLYFSNRSNILPLPPPTYSNEAIFNDLSGNGIPVATWHIPENSRFWAAVSITNNASLLRLTNGVWSRAPGIRELRWAHGVGFTLISEVPNHPWKVEVRSAAAWKFVLGPFFITLPPRERVWRSDLLPSRSQPGDAPNTILE